jgi:hypothetical protein
MSRARSVEDNDRLVPNNSVNKVGGNTTPTGFVLDTVGSSETVILNPSAADNVL